MATTYEWTDWITHVPGQELPAGMYGIFEFLGSRTNGGVPWTNEGQITHAMRGHGAWKADNPHGKYAMMLRYKLRFLSEEAEHEANHVQGVDSKKELCSA